MSKKTKDSNLSIEERLEQALVPNWDYPYEIPHNWKFFWFTKLIDIEGGTQPPKSNFVEYELDGYIRLVQIRDFSSDKYIIYVPDSNKLRHFNENDILIARYGASLGKICTGLKGVYNVALAKTVFSEKVLNRKYVYWMLHSEAFQNPLMAISRTAQAGFNKEDLSRFAMPLPPLEEQERIVVCIESLFAKLDEAKDKAQEVVDGFETRKAAILHKAFSGELTAKWREENGENYSDWKFSMLGNHLYPMRTKKPSGEVFRYIDIDSIDNINQCVREPKIISVKEAPSRASRAVKIGSVLFSMVRPYLKNIALISEDLTDCIASTGFYVCDCKTDLLPQYLYELLRSDDAINYLMQFMKGDNSPSIRKDDLLEMVIAMPSILEQMEIVRILKELISKEQQAKESAASVIEQINTMKKAILARAFRGELSTNDPSEESAVELLKKKIGEK